MESEKFPFYCIISIDCVDERRTNIDSIACACNVLPYNVELN